MEDYVLTGINKGLCEIIFLEHLENGIDYFETTWLTEEDFDYYYSEGLRLRKKYADRIRVGIGVEVGYNPERTESILSHLERRHWDRVGISCHFIRLPGVDHHINLLSRKQVNINLARRAGISRILDSYFETLREAVLRIPANVLCHLDAALRYVDHTFSQTHLDKIDALLQAVQQRGMALEINTSGIPIRGMPFPAHNIIKQALAYNIPLVAGSDAHAPQDVGRHFGELPNYIT